MKKLKKIETNQRKNLSNLFNKKTYMKILLK